MVMRFFILSLFIVLVGCANISQDTFTVERQETFDLKTEYGSTIHTLLMFQSADIETTYSAEDIAWITYAFLIEAQEMFGFNVQALTGLSNVTYYIVRENSSLWTDICDDEYGYLWHIDGC